MDFFKWLKSVTLADKSDRINKPSKIKKNMCLFCCKSIEMGETFCSIHCENVYNYKKLKNFQKLNS